VRCPWGLHVTIDAETLQRVKETGHPRLLKNLLAGTAAGFDGVTIERCSVIEEVGCQNG
jgi:hypothetical protein